MFTCPTNEIHSLYLDNELPQNYVAEYEAHIVSCEKCKAALLSFVLYAVFLKRMLLQLLLIRPLWMQAMSVLCSR